jgi:hypothetical protein
LPTPKLKGLITFEITLVKYEILSNEIEFYIHVYGIFAVLVFANENIEKWIFIRSNSHHMLSNPKIKSNKNHYHFIIN